MSAHDTHWSPRKYLVTRKNNVLAITMHQEVALLNWNEKKLDKTYRQQVHNLTSFFREQRDSSRELWQHAVGSQIVITLEDLDITFIPDQVPHGRKRQTSIAQNVVDDFSMTLGSPCSGEHSCIHSCTVDQGHGVIHWTRCVG